MTPDLPRWRWMRFDRPEGTSFLAVVWGAVPTAVWVFQVSDGWRWGNPYPAGWSKYPTAAQAMRAAELVLQEQQAAPAQSIDLDLAGSRTEVRLLRETLRAMTTRCRHDCTPESNCGVCVLAFDALRHAPIEDP
jgi:hypothetical protein